MRSVLWLSLVVLAATPVLAERRHPDDTQAARIAERLNDPAMQSAVSGAMVAMTDAFMGLRLDGIRAAIGRIDPDAVDDGPLGGDARTLGDVVARDDPYFRERLADDTRAGAEGVGAMASGMAAMLPELRAIGDRLSRDIERSMRRFPTR